MAKRRGGGKLEHDIKDRIKKYKKQRKIEERYQKKEDPYSLNVLFYGRADWYGILSGKLKLNDNISHCDFNELPSGTSKLDVIILDAIRENGDFPAEMIFDFIKDDDPKAKICLSYKPGSDISELISQADEMFTYYEIREMKQYLSKLREAKKA